MWLCCVGTGLLNRLSEANVESIASEISSLFQVLVLLPLSLWCLCLMLPLEKRMAWVEGLWLLIRVGFKDLTHSTRPQCIHKHISEVNARR
jgi:hypothetical protein